MPVAVGVLAIGVGVWLWLRWRAVSFQWDLFLGSLSELAWPWVLASSALILVTYFARALRWAVMLRPVKAKPGLWNLFVATAIGFTAVVLLGRAGELVRPYLISVRERVPLSSQLAAWGLERIYDLLAVLTLFGFALSQVDTSRGSLSEGLLWALQIGGYLVGGLASICLIVLLLIRLCSDAMRRRVLEALGFLPAHQFRKAEGVVTAFVEGLGSTRQSGAVGWLILYTFLEWAVITGGYWCLFQASRWTAGFRVGDVLVFMGFVSLGSVIQIPGVGGGVQVASVVVLREIFGVPLEAAVGIAIVIWAVTFVVIVPFGLVLSVHEGISWRKIKVVKEQVRP